MAVEIEVDPLLAGAAFGKTEYVAVEVARRGEVVDGNGEVEWREAHGRSWGREWDGPIVGLYRVQ
jgi:hypothetical protein